MRRLWLLFSLLVACDDAPSDSPAPASASSPAPTFDARRAWRQPLASPAAFDLIWTDDAALLAWSDPEGRLHLSRLTPAGDTQERTATDEREAEVVELAAASSGGRLALVWAEQASTQPDRGAIGALVGDATTLELGEEADLGRARLGKLGQRRHVLAAGNPRGELVAYSRGEDEPCERAQAGPCATYGLHQLPPAHGGAGRPRLFVPSTCGLAGLAMQGVHWHYAVCSRESGKPATTLFTARREPSYAQALEVLSGCEPTGSAVLDGDLWVTAACGSQSAAVRAHGIDVSRKKIATTGSTLRCEERGVVLDLGAGGEHLLDDPGDRLGPILPVEVAPPPAAAVWTGQALLVARPLGRELELARYRCVDGAFLRDR